MRREEQTIERYNKDLYEMGGYIYTAKKVRKSMDLFNKRATMAIANLIDFKGKSVIDVGCGDGTYSVELFEKLGAKSVVGVEPSNACELAREKFAHYAPSVRFERGSAYKLQYNDLEFDVAMMRGVLHHLDDPKSGLAEMFRVAKRVFLLEPNGYNAVIKFLEKVSPYHRTHQERSFAPKKIRHMARYLGAEAVRESYSSLVPLLCPDRLATFLDWLSPIWERLLFLPKISCGLYCVLFQLCELKSTK